MTFCAGQCWTYRTPAGFEGSRLVIGAIARFGEDAGFGESAGVVCCGVLGAPRRRRDGTLEAVTIPFLPMAAEAFAETAVELAGHAEPPAGFAESLAAWQEDPLGLMTFTVPFEGFLDRLIAMQMAAIVGRGAT